MLGLFNILKKVTEVNVVFGCEVNVDGILSPRACIQLMNKNLNKLENITSYLHL